MAGKAAPDVDLRGRAAPSNGRVVWLAAAAAAAVFAMLYARSPARAAAASAPTPSSWGSLVAWLVLRTGQICVGSFVFLLGLLVTQQRKILYVPVPPGMQRSMKDNPEPYQSPGKYQLPFEDVMIETADGVRVNAWLIYQPSSSQDNGEVPYTIVYFHGNAGNIGHRLENLHDMHRHLKVNLLIVDYRGYGDSEDGSGPCERGFMLDALATYSWCVERARATRTPGSAAGKNGAKSDGGPRMSEDRLLLFGRSIGGAVAIGLMAELIKQKRATSGREALPLPAGIILENTFTSLRDMALQLFPFLSVVGVLLRPPLIFDPWASMRNIAYISDHHRAWACCLLSGQRDEIVPPEQMRRLRDLLSERPPEVLEFHTFERGGHNDTPIRGGVQYWAAFRKFLERVSQCEEVRRKGGAVE